ncbi:MAG TPA: MOSC domain-containing protein [Acidimicrobiales bacterium]
MASHQHTDAVRGRDRAPVVVSVQAGRVQVLDAPARGDRMPREWTSAIFKSTVEGRRAVRTTGLDGDEQADLVNHGGPDKALLAYSAENLASWHDLLGPVPNGGFGENLTISGQDETTVCLGDRYRIGEVLVECSQPRQPCWKLDRRWNRRDLSARVMMTGRTGWYLRVLELGTVGAGDAVELVERPNPAWPVVRVARIMLRMEHDPRAEQELVALPELSAAWRDRLLARLR